MDSITVTVKKPCVAAWVCPKCNHVSVVRTRWSQSEEVLLTDKEARFKSFNKLESEIADRILKQYGQPRVLDYAKKPGKKRREEIDYLGCVKCTKCRCRPSWSVPRRPFPWWFLGMIVIMTIILLLWMLMVFGYKQLAITLLVGGIIIVPILASVVALVMIMTSEMRRECSCRATELQHRPLVAYSCQVELNETDPRSVALIRYLKKHAWMDWSVSVKRRVHVEFDP